MCPFLQVLSFRSMSVGPSPIQGKNNQTLPWVGWVSLAWQAYFRISTLRCVSLWIVRVPVAHAPLDPLVLLTCSPSCLFPDTHCWTDSSTLSHPLQFLLFRFWVFPHPWVWDQILCYLPAHWWGWTLVALQGWLCVLTQLVALKKTEMSRCYFLAYDVNLWREKCWVSHRVYCQLLWRPWSYY